MLKHLGPTLLSLIASCAYSQDDLRPVPADVQTPRGVDVHLTADARPHAETVIVRGIVQGIDPVNRLFALTDSTGKTTTIYAGANVQDFERLQLGAAATVRYSKAVALTIARNGVFGKQALEAETVAEPLSKPLLDIPAERLQAQTSMFGRVAAIDAPNRYVIIEDPDGQEVEMRVLSDDVMTNLKIGQRVLVTYAQATAISARPE